jgi:CMP-N-acetylneuraminic acid synthetase
MEYKRIIAMIPARIGSQRLAKKNLALLGDKPLIYHSINAAKRSNIFEKIIINSDSIIFKKIAERYNVGFYNRPKKLGSSNTKSDEVIYDFMKKHKGDVLVWVNPIAPLQTSEKIREVVNYFIKGEYDSLITVKNENVHCVMDSDPVNYNPNELFAKTQDLKSVQPFVYSLMMWKYDSFINNFENQGFALMSGKLGFYCVDAMSSVIIKNEDDLRFAEYILAGMKAKKNYKIKYDELVN